MEFVVENNDQDDNETSRWSHARHDDSGAGGEAKPMCIVLALLCESGQWKCKSGEELSVV